MPLKYYLLDASAFIYAVEKYEEPDFIEEKENGEAFLYLPQFCVTEILNAYGRFFWEEGKLDSEDYTKWRGAFLKLVRDRKTIYCYDLHRYHIKNADKVFKVEHTIDRIGSPLSSFDILIIAMGIELKKIHPHNDVIILTRDKQLKKVSNEVGVTAQWYS